MESLNFPIYTLYLKCVEFLKHWKIPIISTLLIGVLAHGYAFFNYLPTWDSIQNVQGVGITYTSGRWFLPFMGKLFSEYSLPFVNGIISLIFITFSVILILKIYDIRNSLFSILISGIIVTFPTVSSAFAFMFTADCYMVSFALSLLSVYICKKYPRFGFLPASSCVCFSIAIYQAFLSVTIISVITLFIIDLFFNKPTIKKLFINYYKYVLSVFIGYILYTIALKISLKLTGQALSEYQGLNSVGLLSLPEFVSAIKINILKLISLFGFELSGIEGRTQAIGIYTVLNLAFLLLFALIVIYCIIREKKYKNPLISLIIAGSFALIPFSICLFRYFSTEVVYDTLMMFSAVFLYLMFIIIIAKSQHSSRIISLIKSASVIVICCLITYNTINANVNYFYMDMRYERTFNLASDILDDICETPEYLSETDKVAVWGANAKLLQNDHEYNPTLPFIRGSEDTHNVLISQRHYKVFWFNFFGMDINTATADEVYEISKTEEFKNMPCYPQKGYIKCINKIIVVKLCEEEQQYGYYGY